MDRHDRAGDPSPARSLPSEEVDVTYRRILLSLDGSAMAEQALPHAITQAQCCGAELILLRVVEPFPYVPGMSLTDVATIRERTEEWARNYFERISAELERLGIPVETILVEGRPGPTIIQYAEENQVDLLVLCSRGRSGLSRWLLGSVADRVVRGATVPVLLVHAQEADDENQPQNTLLPGP
jgi:nucleotide-binding universal stress UspA family protein